MSPFASKEYESFPFFVLTFQRLWQRPCPERLLFLRKGMTSLPRTVPVLPCSPYQLFSSRHTSHVILYTRSSRRPRATAFKFQQFLKGVNIICWGTITADNTRQGALFHKPAFIYNGWGNGRHRAGPDVFTLTFSRFTSDRKQAGLSREEGRSTL